MVARGSGTGESVSRRGTAHARTEVARLSGQGLGVSGRGGSRAPLGSKGAEGGL